MAKVLQYVHVLMSCLKAKDLTLVLLYMSFWVVVVHNVLKNPLWFALRFFHMVHEKRWKFVDFNAQTQMYIP